MSRPRVLPAPPPAHLAPPEMRIGSSGPDPLAPRTRAEMELLARTHTVSMLRTLVRIAEDQRAPPVAQIMAANSVLDRGWGTAKQTVVHEQGPGDLSDEQLAEAIESRLERLFVGRTIEHDDSALASAPQALRPAQQPVGPAWSSAEWEESGDPTD